MKKNEISQPLIMNCKCNFSHMVLGTYNMAISCQFQRNFYSYLSYPIIIKGNLKEKGCRFILKREDLDIYMFYEITDIIITDYYTLFKFHVYKTIPETFEFDHFLEIRYVNEDQFTLFVVYVAQNKYLSEKEISETVKVRKEVYNNIIKSLEKFNILKIASVYQSINCKIELIWDIIRNMKMIHKYSHFLADQVEYNGNILKKGLIIKFIEKNKNNDKTVYTTIAKVKKCSMKKGIIEKECNIQILFTKDNKFLSLSSPAKKIIITIYEYENKCSIYILFFFKDNLNKDQYTNFVHRKNNELIKFKNIVENYNMASKTLSKDAG